MYSYFLARKKQNLERSIINKKLKELQDKFMMKIYYSLFFYPFFKLQKNVRNNLTVLKFDVWEESSYRISKIRHLPFLIKRMFDPQKIFFVDIDKKLVELAKKNIKKFGFKKALIYNADISNMPFKDGSFDLIIDFSTTDHLKMAKLKKTIEEIYRVLKKKGFAIIYHLNSEYFNIKQWNYAYSKTFPSYPRKLSTFEKLLGKKFKIIKYGYCFPFFADTTLLIFYRFVYNKLYRFLPRKLLFSFFDLPKLNLFFYLIIRKI